MIPNAVSSTGPYAGFWSFLKSIDHALARAISATSSGVRLAVLDKERLAALAEFLEMGLVPAGAIQPDLLAISSYKEPHYGSAINLREKATEVPEFDSWRKSSRLGFEEKMKRLIQELREFVGKRDFALFMKTPAPPELAVLSAIVRSLLDDAEAAMQP